ncbi:LysR family transcriptional regulator [Roseibacterium sp. SDUM158016]|uniref:LysR family transcriptional regulator n=1 Tax=Roseicyclus sediminis TaxID=2980997 RepID=UPI0021D1B67F|nr:LysR family transcriptional regulator [Roseibacterium sp. SDUM158016]MCU4651713.1 LysR family transcriptional regulator [Roseibacterium sp. SDUM158016]
MIAKLEMFLAVAKEEHFGRAAESLGITQPTLSTGIKQLEEILGVQLIFRGHRYGGLTPEGQRALVWARQLVSDARTFREEMRVARHGLSGHVRLAVIPTALTWAAALSARFAERHPNVRFTILSRTSAEILGMLENLDIDAGLSYLDNEPLGRVVTVPIYRERYVLVCRSDCDLADKARVAWSDLEGRRMCLLTPDMQNRRIINQNFMAAGVTADAQVESNSTLVLAAHVREGDWVTILPSDMGGMLAAGAGLCIRPMEGQTAQHTVGLVAPYREPHTPVLDALLSEAQALRKSAESVADGA